MLLHSSPLECELYIYNELPRIIEKEEEEDSNKE